MVAEAECDRVLCLWSFFVWENVQKMDRKTCEMI